MLIDISQEVSTCRTFPGDPKPVSQRILSLANGDSCNLTAFSMCAHNGTHVDAPHHFIRDGKTIRQIGLSVFAGECFVFRHSGNVSAGDAAAMLHTAQEAGAGERILIAGRAVVTEEAAFVFAESGVLLLGNESQTFGPEDAPEQVHMILLGADIVLLEGIVLTDVPEGKYFLSAVPLNLGDCDGAPCRAYLMR